MELNEALSNEFKEHIGKTVTIYTTSGGNSGRGYTGMLVNVNCFFIRLIKHIDPAPCTSANYGSKKCYNCKLYLSKLVGPSTIIPINKITAFVYNSIN